MNPGPSKAMEVVVGFLIPTASREHVLGDLYERYTCPQQYILDAIWIVPCVIVSRIRRTTNPQLLLMEAFTLYLSFLGCALLLEDKAFLHQQWSLLRLAIPTVSGLIALILGDAYALSLIGSGEAEAGWGWRESFGAVSITCVGVSAGVCGGCGGLWGLNWVLVLRSLA